MGADGHRDCPPRTGLVRRVNLHVKTMFYEQPCYVRWFALVLYCGVSAEGGEDVVGVWVYVGVLGVHVAFDYAV